MSVMIIPHRDPDPPKLETPIPVDFPKEAGLTWSDFHPDADGSNTLYPQPQHASSVPQWCRVADELIDLRTRFIRQHPLGVHPRCSNVDRSAVLAVYNEALLKLEHAANIDAIKINLEVKTKVSTILDIRNASPDDAVFYKKGAFLSPLEPHYAQPRLDYYDRGTGDGDDSYYWTGLRRLREWRKGGWPDAYPEEAIEREKERVKRRRRDSVGLGDIHKEDLLVALTADPLEWGEEMDADPDRPWR